MAADELAKLSSNRIRRRSQLQLGSIPRCFGAGHFAAHDQRCWPGIAFHEADDAFMPPYLVSAPDRCARGVSKASSRGNFKFGGAAGFAIAPVGQLMGRAPHRQQGA